jgi:chorismate mutase / prephenate dehydratase
MSSSVEAVPGPDTTAKSSSDSLPALRDELDALDDRILALLMERAAVVERVAAIKQGGPLRPGREAAILRRLLARHSGAFPRSAVVRVWREIFASSIAQQQNFSVAVCDPAMDGRFAAAAREHLGALTPLRVYRSSAQAIGEVVEGRASAAILPLPGEASAEGSGAGPGWWPGLLQQHQKGRIHVVARLPFWGPRPEGAPGVQALVVAASAADPSGDDMSLIALEMDAQISRASLSTALAAAGFKPVSILLYRPPGAPIALILVEVAGFVALDDPRLAQIRGLQGAPLLVGAYAVAIGEEAASS